MGLRPVLMQDTSMHFLALTCFVFLSMTRHVLRGRVKILPSFFQYFACHVILYSSASCTRAYLSSCSVILSSHAVQGQHTVHTVPATVPWLVQLGTLCDTAGRILFLLVSGPACYCCVLHWCVLSAHWLKLAAQQNVLPCIRYLAYSVHHGGDRYWSGKHTADAKLGSRILQRR